MDDSHFDQLARAFGALRTRRTALLLLGGVAAAPALGTSDAEAKPKKKRKKKPCKARWKKCGGKCVSLQTDDNNCGACGNRCPANQTCRAGQCETSLPPGCPDNQVCNGNGRCRAGVCQPRPTCSGNGVTFRQGEGQCCSENVSCQAGTTGVDCTCMPGDVGNACLVNSDCETGSCIGYQCACTPPTCQILRT